MLVQLELHVNDGQLDYNLLQVIHPYNTGVHNFLQKLQPLHYVHAKGSATP